MLVRVYGTAWHSKEQLEAYTRLKEEAARRDHRRLGQELDLFSVDSGCGGGLVFWHPKGAMVRHLIETYWKDIHLQRGYQLLYTPHVAKARASRFACRPVLHVPTPTGHSHTGGPVENQRPL